MRAMLEYFSAIAGAKSEECHWVTSDGRMGSEWIPESISEIEFAHSSKGPTSANDTSDAISSLLNSGIDLLVYAGGDGTTRDIVSALSEADSPKLPVIGVPTGVKMHSGCFASSPKAAAEVLASWIGGDLLIASTEVLDLDEDLYRQGKWVVRIYAEVMTPSSPRWMQGAKMRVEASGEDEIVEGIAEHIEETIVEDDRLVLWGSGGTLRSIGKIIGFKLTTLGIDATKGSQQVGTDINEREILEILDSHEGPVTLLLSPMGGQGFLIGRGNLQLSPNVLKRIGVDGVLGIVTPAKLLTLRSLRIETGDEELDSLFSEKKYLKVLQGYRTTRILPVSVD
jgi:predicted polyphosphate/ATP-dependent NAD kinase